MWLHFMLIVLLGLSALVSNSSRRGKSGSLFVLGVTFVAFLLLTSLRMEDVGNDTINYASFFARAINNLDFWQLLLSSRFEIGFSFVVYVIAQLTGNFNIFLLCVTAFYLYSVCRFVRKFAISYGSVVLLAFGFSVFYDSFVTLRQCIAIGIYLFAIDSFLDRKPLRYSALVLVACSFHLSAVVLLPVYLLPKMRFAFASDYIKILFAAICCTIMVSVFLHLFAGLFPYYAHYLDTAYGKGGPRLASVLLLGVRLVLVLLAFASNWRTYQSLSGKSPEIAGLNTLMAVDLILSAASLSFNMLDRIEGYFTLPFIIVVSNSINCKENANGRICDLFAVLVSFAYITILLVFRGEWFGIFPYSMIV